VRFSERAGANEIGALYAGSLVRHLGLPIRARLNHRHPGLFVRFRTYDKS